MAVIKVQIELPMDSAVPGDSVVNGLYFSRAGAAPFDAGELDAVFDTVEAQYDGIASFLGVNLDTANMVLTAYDMNDPTPRVPMLTEIRTLSATATDTLPAEVALCLSFKADPVSGVPAGRLRGRIFLGPWGIAANVATTGRPTSTVQTGLQLFGQQLADPANYLQPGINWVVYSPTLRGVGAAEDGTSIVTSGWVDNAWDTQRRRGLAPGSRVTFTGP